MPLQIRRGTSAERSAMSTPLASGELLWVTDDQRLYIGDGTTLGGVTANSFNAEDAQDAVSTLFTDGSHTGISFSYSDVGNTISATVDLSDYEGILKANGFNGSLFADDSTQLINAIDGKIELDGTVKGDIVPDAGNAYDIGGDVSTRFKDIYTQELKIGTGPATISATGSVINLPAGTTIGGNQLQVALNEFFDGDVQGSVYADDSSTCLVSGTDLTLRTAGLIFEHETISSTNEEPLFLYNGREETSLQVVFPVIKQPTTGGDILSNLDSMKFVEILAYATDIYRRTDSVPVPHADDVVAGDLLGGFKIAGLQSSTQTDAGSLMGAQADPAGTLTSTHIPTKMFWTNSPETEAQELAGDRPIMTFDCKGQLGVGKQIPEATLDVEGFAKLKVLNSAPTVSSDGDGTFAIADGTGWDPLGNPGKQQMVVYLAGAWRQVAVQP